jgi:DNA-binding CsgD family transcriptional regulator/tetratricopeptide (TPR) repeat protein
VVLSVVEEHTGTMALLERDSSLDALLLHAAEARRGDGRLVLLAGEAGIGKSALVEALQRELPDARWAWGACDGLSTPPPLAPLADIAGALGGRLLDLVEQRVDRDALFRALLQSVSEDPGLPDGLTVLVVEDVHWADEATLDMLRFLARRIRASPVLLVVSYRNDSLAPDSPLRVALGELSSLRWSRHLELQPLSSHAIAQLTEGSDLDPGEVAALTGGNPFYVAEMVVAGSLGVPVSARDAVLARTARMGPEAARVLAAAALAGTRVEPSVLTAATGCDHAVLDELVDSGLVVSEGRGLRFRHEIARMTVDEQVPSHRRAAVHAALLDALVATKCTRPSRLAFHAEGAGDTAAVLEHSSRAAREAAAVGSHREAAAQYERALRAADDADDATVAALLSGLAEESSLGDRWQTAADADERALPLWRGLDDRKREAETLRRYSLALKNLCRGEEGLAAAVQAVRILEPLGEGPELASAYATLAVVRMMRNERADAVELARRAQNLGKRWGAIGVVADALDTEGCALKTRGDDWIEPIRRALELSLSHNLQTQAARAYNNLYCVLTEQHRFAEAEQYYEDGIAYCDEHDLATFTFCLRSTRIVALEQVGRWDEALALSRQLLDEATTSPLNRIGPHTLIGTLQARHGEPEGRHQLDEALSLVQGTSQPMCIVPVRLARAESFWLDGRTDDARAEAELAADEALALDGWTNGLLRAWLHRLGSDRVVDDAVAEPFHLVADGRHAEAAALWDRLGSTYDAALVLLDVGDEASVRGALRRLDALGATATAALARRRLRDLGARSIPAGPRQHARSHPGGLTSREHEVLELIGQRRTNAQIARLLFISPKTVEHHVSAVLAKLEVGDRESAFASARRLGLLSAPAR